MLYPSRRQVLLAVVTVLGAALKVATAGVIFVDDDGSGKDGNSWAEAFNELQEALAVFRPGDQIWVAAGVYKPDYDRASGRHTLNQQATFDLPAQAVIYGGFAGHEETLEERAGLFEQTILSGDLAGDDAPGFVNTGDNSRHVVDGSLTTASALLDGFTITGGSAAGPFCDRGGGLVLEGGKLRVRGCIFRENKACEGGGLYADHSAAVLENCTFSGNNAQYGGGVYLSHASVVFRNCVITRNTAQGGAGAYIRGGDPVFDDCALADNHAGNAGGLLAEENSGLTLRGCSIVGNSADALGGVGLHGAGRIIRCIVAGNTAAIDAGIVLDGGAQLIDSLIVGNQSVSKGSAVTLIQGLVRGCTLVDNLAFGGEGVGLWLAGTGIGTVVENSILWNNFPVEISAPVTSLADVRHCNVRGSVPSGLDGGGNIELPPHFVDADGPDDRAETWLDNNYRLRRSSPGVDAGRSVFIPANGAADLDGNPRRQGAALDMGAYEFDPDCDDNGSDDLSDIAFGTAADCTGNGIPDNCEPDCNGNGRADSCDLAADAGADCTGNGIPDECEADCDANGMADTCQVAADGQADLNDNGVPDACESFAVIHADDDAPSDPGPGDPTSSDAAENGSASHPFDVVQEAIDAAAEGDVVLVAAGVYTGAGNRDLNYGGKPITVRGAGRLRTVIDPQRAGRGFVFQSGEGRQAQVLDLTIRRGEAIVGGGVYCLGSSPTIRRCVIAENRAQWGAGVHCKDGSGPAIQDCVIRDNFAADDGYGLGGGLYYEDSVAFIERCRIIGNAAELEGGGGEFVGGGMIARTVIADNAAKYGGGVAAGEGLELLDCLIAGNRATGSGAAVVMAGCTVRGCSIVDNTGPGIEALRVYEGHSRIRNSILWNPWSVELQLAGGSADVHFSLVEEELHPDIGQAQNIIGAAVFVDIDGPDDVRETHADNDYGLRLGSPGVDAGDPQWVPDSAARDVQGGPRLRGGVIDIGARESDADCNANGRADDLDVAGRASLDCDSNGVPDECQPDCNGSRRPDVCDVHAGASADLNLNGVPDECESFAIVHVDDDGPADPAPGDASGSDPLEDGGSDHPFDAIQEAVHAAAGGDLVMVADGVYAGSGNFEIDFDGRPVVVRSLNGPQASRLDAASEGRGFIFSNGESPAARIHGLTITGGDADLGGAVYCRPFTRPVISGCILAGNSAGWGGAVFGYEKSGPVILDSTLAGNVATIGGAAYLWGQGAIVRCRILDNAATDYDGGLVLYPATEVRDCLIAGNSAPRESGGVVTRGSLLLNCTIVGNSNTLYGGGGILTGDTHTTIRNCIIRDNTEPQIWVHTGSAQVSNSIIPEGLDPAHDGGQNLTADPLFVDPLQGDYRLGSSSPGIDAGDLSEARNENEKDIDGQPRVKFCRVDSGAYESDAFADCNANDLSDGCELVDGSVEDCNTNGQPDACDIASGRSQDDDEDGVPDECAGP